MTGGPPTRLEMKTAEAEYALRCHPTKLHTPATTIVLIDLARRSQLNKEDLWAELEKIDHIASGKKINATTIKAAFRSFMDKPQEGRCCYCRTWLVSNAHARPIEHILPRAQYPQYSMHFWNLAVACTDCNGLKSNAVWGSIPKNRRTYPVATQFVDSFHPRFHRYHEHIRYVLVETNHSTLAIYEGLTDQGRHLCNELLYRVAAKRTLYASNPELRKSKQALDDYKKSVGPLATPALEAFENLLDKSVENLLHLP